jgi:peptidyl-prolyl cis-trans isomerase C
VQKPISSRYGVHVAFIDQRVEGRRLEFDMVSQRIADYLNEKVRRKAIAQYIETLIAKADIEGFDFSVSDSPLMQ